MIRVVLTLFLWSSNTFELMAQKDTYEQRVVGKVEQPDTAKKLKRLLNHNANHWNLEKCDCSGCTDVDINNQVACTACPKGRCSFVFF